MSNRPELSPEGDGQAASRGPEEDHQASRSLLDLSSTSSQILRSLRANQEAAKVSFIGKHGSQVEAMRARTPNLLEYLVFQLNVDAEEAARRVLEDAAITWILHAERRIRECKECPDTGGHCARQFSVELLLKPGQIPVINDVGHTITKTCDRWPSYLVEKKLLDSGVPPLLVEMGRNAGDQIGRAIIATEGKAFVASEEELAWWCRHSAERMMGMKFLSVDSSIVSRLRAHWSAGRNFSDPLEEYSEFDGVLFVHAVGRLSDATLDDVERLLNRRRLLKRNTMLLCPVLRRRMDRDAERARKAAESERTMDDRRQAEDPEEDYY